MKRRTVTIPEAGEILGLKRSAAYRAAKAGDIPTIAIGSRYLVPLSWLEETIGESVTLDDDVAPAVVKTQEQLLRAVSSAPLEESCG